MRDRSTEIAALLQRFDLTLQATSVELFLFRARTFLLELLRWRAAELGVQGAAQASIWKLVRHVLGDSAYANLRTNIGVILEVRNAIAHDLAVGLSAAHVQACAKIAGLPELQSYYDLADECERVSPKKENRQVALELRSGAVNCAVSIAAFRTIASVLVEILKQPSTRGQLTAEFLSTLEHRLHVHVRNKRAKLRRAASLLRHALAYSKMRFHPSKHTSTVTA